MRVWAGFLAGAVALAGGAAHATDTQLAITSDDVQSRMTYQSTAGVAAAVTTGYSGVGSLIMRRTGVSGASICTGSLINSTTVLTAAHCVYDYRNGALSPLSSIEFHLPSFGDRNLPGSEVFVSSSHQYNPLYDNAAHTGRLTSGFDLALVTLNRAAKGYDTYGLFMGDPLQQFTQVGTGTVGGPTGTNSALTDYKKRVGTNIYEFYGNQVFASYGAGVVLADFDSGLAQHDVFGRFKGRPQLGVLGESNSSPGDSGGPAFIEGRIATVTSFGITGGVFQGFCGGTNNPVDPNHANGNCTNSSIGEIMGNTLVKANKQFINNYFNWGAVPEPSTWGLLILGFGAIGSSMRRRQTVRTAFA